MNFKDELIDIKGIGRSTAEDIIAVYKTRESLEVAIYSSEKLPFDSDVEKLLKKHFKPKETKNIKVGVRVKTTGESLKITRLYNPTIEFIITPEPVKVTKEQAEYLLKTYKKRIIKG